MSNIRFIEDKTYPFRVEQVTDGWSGAGFDHSETSLKIRIVREGVAQIEIGITEVKGNRVYAHHSSVELPVNFVAKLVEVLSQGDDPDPALAEYQHIKAQQRT